MALFAQINGNLISHLRVEVPFTGIWYADVILPETVVLTGNVSITIADLTLFGTIVPKFSGTYGLMNKYRVVGGNYNWGKVLPVKDYHNDFPILLKDVLADLALGVNERLINLLPTTLTVGTDFVREQRAANLILNQLVPNQWWMGLDGITRISSSRIVAPQTPNTTDYDLISVDILNKKATIATQTPSVIGIGSIITSPLLTVPFMIKEYTLSLQEQTLRIIGWA